MKPYLILILLVLLTLTTKSQINDSLLRRGDILLSLPETFLKVKVYDRLSIDDFHKDTVRALLLFSDTSLKANHYSPNYTSYEHDLSVHYMYGYIVIHQDRFGLKEAVYLNNFKEPVTEVIWDYKIIERWQ